MNDNNVHYKLEYVKPEIFLMSMVAPFSTIKKDVNELLDLNASEVTYRRLVDTCCDAKTRKGYAWHIKFAISQKVRKNGEQDDQKWKEESKRQEKIGYQKFINSIKQKIHATTFLEIGRLGFSGLMHKNPLDVDIFNAGLISAICPSMKTWGDVEEELGLKDLDWWSDEYRTKQEELYTILREQQDSRTTLKLRQWKMQWDKETQNQTAALTVVK